MFKKANMILILIFLHCFFKLSLSAFTLTFALQFKFSSFKDFYYNYTELMIIYNEKIYTNFMQIL